VVDEILVAIGAATRLDGRTYDTLTSPKGSSAECGIVKVLSQALTAR
jgi:hypothetical protein